MADADQTDTSVTEDAVEYLESELVDLLSNEEVRDRIIQIAAGALPLPNFIEKRILHLAYGALLEAVKSATKDSE
jgi:hypothetical protein